MLRELVAAVALAEIAGAKTTAHARHTDLDLASADAIEGAGTKIFLSDAEGTVLAHVVAGAHDFTLGGFAGGQYLRHGGEDATWLARASIDPPPTLAGWFDTALYTTVPEQVLALSLTPSGAAPVKLARSDGTLKIISRLAEGLVAQEAAMHQLVRLFMALDFDDVRTAQEATETEGPLRWVRVDVAGEGEAATNQCDCVTGFDSALRSADAELLRWTTEDMT